jgi:glycosyltransferase involved in cell wall biosynthesis
MRVLSTLTYYSPHISGLTVYARRVLGRLAQRGHEVTVLTSRYSNTLPTREQLDGVRVVRARVLFSLSKGTFAPLFLWHAARLIRANDVVYLHLPQFEASGVALIARLMRKPVVVTYHCDIELPPGLTHSLFTPLIRLSHYVTGLLAHKIVVNTEEYGSSARLPRFFHKKVTWVYPPIEVAPPASDRENFRRQHGLGEAPVAGFVGRFAEEKGIGDFIDAVPLVLRELPDARFALAGPTGTVPGEHVHERLAPKIAALGDTIVQLGAVSDGELSAFYQAIDVLVLPSTNSTESFGMTQAEAMVSGTPVIASDISGVREAVRVTGMGLLVPPRDPGALAQAIVAVLRDRAHFVQPLDAIRARFDPDATTSFYEELFSDLTRGHTAGRTAP